MNAMDRTGSTSQLAPKNSRRQFFQWAVKWFYANLPEDTSTKSDIPSIICLLQAVGFKLREFEKRSQPSSGEDEVKNENIRVILECGTSKMKAVLEMDSIRCECPDYSKTKDGSFWSISGTGPMASMDNLNKIEETGSNLLPEVSKEAVTVIRDVVYRLFKVIKNQSDVCQDADLDAKSPCSSKNRTITKSTESREGLVRSYTDLYDQSYKTRTSTMSSSMASSRQNSTKNLKDSAGPDKPLLKRQGTYEIDENESMEEPRPSPPKLASSPVLQQLCNSLGQISLQSDEEALSLADYVIKAHQILDNAVNHIIKKMPVDPIHSPIQDDANFVRPAPPPLMSSSFHVGSPGQKVKSLINRSISNVSASRLGSFLSSARPGQVNRIVPSAMQKITAQRNGGISKLPPMRDRSSSLSAAQRPQQQPSPRTLASQIRRKSSTGLATAGLVQRSTSVNTKLPTVKLAQHRISSGNLSVQERTVLTAKRRSPDAKSQTSSSTMQSRANVSLIKAPSSTSRLNSASSMNTSKFGFTSVKK